MTGFTSGIGRSWVSDSMGVPWQRRTTYLFMAKLKSYITEKTYRDFRVRYKECIRMLNGLEKTLERKVPERDRRWQVSEESKMFGLN